MSFEDLRKARIEREQAALDEELQVREQHEASVVDPRSWTDYQREFVNQATLSLINPRTLPKQHAPCGFRRSQAHCPALIPVLISSTIAARAAGEAVRISPTQC